MRERHLIAFLTTVQFVHMVDFVIMMPLGPMLMREMAIGTTEFAWMLSAYTFAAATSGILAGFFIDRFDRRRALLVLLPGFALATFACGFAPDHWAMVATRAAAGFFGGVLSATVMVVVPDAIPPERRGRALGIIMTSFSLASIVGIPVGMTLAEHLGWHAPFIWLGLTGGAILGWAWWAFPAMAGHVQADRPSPARVLVEVFREPAHLRAFAMMTGLVLGGFTVISFLNPFLVGNLGFTIRQQQLVYLFGGIMTVVTAPLIGRLTDRFGAKRVLAVVGGASLVPLLAITHLEGVAAWQALIVSTVFIILVSGRFVPASTLVANAAVPRLRGSVMSFNGALMSLGTGLGAQIAGLLVTKNADLRIEHFPRVGWIAAGCTLAAIIIATTVRPAAAPVPQVATT